MDKEFPPIFIVSSSDKSSTVTFIRTRKYLLLQYYRRKYVGETSNLCIIEVLRNFQQRCRQMCWGAALTKGSVTFNNTSSVLWSCDKYNEKKRRTSPCSNTQFLLVTWPLSCESDIIRSVTIKTIKYTYIIILYLCKSTSTSKWTLLESYCFMAGVLESISSI